MGSADLTRYALELGSRNSTTGWRNIDHSSSSTIRGAIFQKNSNPFQGIAGSFSTYAHTGYFADLVAEGDIIKDGLNYYFYTRTIPTFEVLDQHQGYFPCEMEKLQNYPEQDITPATPDLEDPRYRTRVWLNNHLSLSNDWASMYAYPDYPLQYEFTGEHVTGNDADDILYCIGLPDTDSLFHVDGNIYGYNEKVPINIAVLQQYTQDNTQKLLWAAEDALRTICDPSYDASTTRRQLTVIRDRTERHGNETIAMRECILSYKRASGYAPTYPRITYGASGSPDGTYYFPNCTRIEWPNGMPDIPLLPPGRVGNVHQIMGGSSWKVRLYCDLDVDNATYTWKRPQTSTPKTDRREDQVFWEMMHQAGIIAGDEPYQTLTFGASGPSFKVRLESMQTVETGDGHTLMLDFEEYVSADASGDSYTTRLGFS